MRKNKSSNTKDNQVLKIKTDIERSIYLYYITVHNCLKNILFYLIQSSYIKELKKPPFIAQVGCTYNHLFLI